MAKKNNYLKEESTSIWRIYKKDIRLFNLFKIDSNKEEVQDYEFKFDDGILHIKLSTMEDK